MKLHDIPKEFQDIMEDPADITPGQTYPVLDQDTKAPNPEYIAKQKTIRMGRWAAHLLMQAKVKTSARDVKITRHEHQSLFSRRPRARMTEEPVVGWMVGGLILNVDAGVLKPSQTGTRSGVSDYISYTPAEVGGSERAAFNNYAYWQEAANNERRIQRSFVDFLVRSGVIEPDELPTAKS